MRPDRPNRQAELFDAFRRELIRRALPVSKEIRVEWETRFKEFIETALPEPRKLFHKPGLAARLFAAEIELPHSHPRDLEVFSQQLDLVWEAKVPKDVVEWRTLTTPDRTDLIWEFAVDLGASYVTGSVKLRNYPFERPERKERTDRPDDRREQRPYQRDNRDRPHGGGGYQGNRDRPQGGGGYQGNRDRPHGGGGYRGDRDRPQGGGGYQGNRDRPHGGGGYQGNRDRPQGGGGYQGNRDRPHGGGGYRGDRDRPQGGGGFKREGGFEPRDRKFGGGRPQGRPFRKRPEKD